MFNKTIASKERVKLMIGLTGPSGSGKTYSALQLAYGITQDWTKIAVADTENRSALYYAGDRTGKWEHIDFSPTMKDGYHPYNWVRLIEFAESDPKTEVLILDSISHEWNGAGGCLQLLDAYARQAKGNTFTPWKTLTPIHDAFIDKMRYSRLHIIGTMRSTTEYAMEVNEKGRTAPRKIGTKPVQRDGLDYEFGIIFDIDINHYATANKDRTSLFAEKPPFQITPDVGAALKAWSLEGQTRPQPKPIETNAAIPVSVKKDQRGLRQMFLEDLRMDEMAIAKALGVEKLDGSLKEAMKVLYDNMMAHDIVPGKDPFDELTEAIDG